MHQNKIIFYHRVGEITAHKKHTQSLHCLSFVLHSDAKILIFCCRNFQIKQNTENHLNIILIIISSKVLSLQRSR